MKFLISIITAVAFFFAVGFSLDEFTRMSGDNILIWAIIVGVIALIVSFYVVKGTILNIDSKQAEYFYIAEQEYEDGEIDKGLWSQALVKAKGDENLRKVEYMKLRAKQLKKKK